MVTIEYPTDGRAPDTRELRSDPEWLRLIARLRAHKSLLIADFKNRFPAVLLYEGRVSEDEIDDLVASTMEMYLLLLSGDELNPALQQLPQDLGRRRARQGVPGQLLLQGVRTNSRVIWNALRGIASDEAAALVRNTDAVLSLVEWHVREVQSSYLREEESLNRHSERRRQRMVDRIFAEPAADPDDLVAVSMELGIRTDGRFDTAIQFTDHDVDCVPCHGAAPTFAAEVADGICHFRPAGRGSLAADLAGNHTVVIESVRGLNRLPGAARAGLALLRAQRRANSEPTTPTQAWPALAWKNLIAVVPTDLLPLDLTALHTLDTSEQTRLVETIRSYLTTGSIKQTAEDLYCHRNTIVKRLDRFRGLVGLDVRIPREAALALLALTDAG